MAVPASELADLTALLRAAQVSHHFAHWAVTGPSFVGDHDLFKEAYESLEVYDKLAEFTVLDHGVKPLGMCAQLKSMLECCEEWESEKNLFKRAVAVEKSIQTVIAKMLPEAKDDAGLDNFLRGVAEQRKSFQFKFNARAE